MKIKENVPSASKNLLSSKAQRPRFWVSIEYNWWSWYEIRRFVRYASCGTFNWSR